MQREDCVDLFKRIPVYSHAQVNLVLHNQATISVDTMVRFEPTYLVMRGREGGSTDEGRAFFVPYEEISYLRIERVVKLGELKRMYGESGYVDAEDVLGQQAAVDAAADAKAPQVNAQTPPTTSPIAAQDPAAIAKQNLLDRIRTARANAGGTTGKIGNK
ncbi:MAG: hypothetical protein JWO38_7980 [Gemmataceae bacterium]|nr:hypothetical protein [Gemmataceae bacterium]